MRDRRHANPTATAGLQAPPSMAARRARRSPTEPRCSIDLSLAWLHTGIFRPSRHGDLHSVARRDLSGNAGNRVWCGPRHLRPDVSRRNGRAARSAVRTFAVGGDLAHSQRSAKQSRGQPRHWRGLGRICPGLRAAGGGAAGAWPARLESTSMRPATNTACSRADRQHLDDRSGRGPATTMARRPAVIPSWRHPKAGMKRPWRHSSLPPALTRSKWRDQPRADARQSTRWGAGRRCRHLRRPTMHAYHGRFAPSSRRSGRPSGRPHRQRPDAGARSPSTRWRRSPPASAVWTGACTSARRAS